MFSKDIFLLLLLLQIVIFAKGKHRVRKRDDGSPDPLLAEIFKSTENEVKPDKEVRTDRSLDAGEELEALLTGFKNKNKHLFPVDGPVKRESGFLPDQTGLDQQNIMTRNQIPVPERNSFQMPGRAEARENQDLNLMQFSEQQQQVNSVPGASFMQQEVSEEQKKNRLQMKNIIPGRPNQKQNDWGNQPGVTVYLHQDKKSSIPIPVKTGSAAVQSPGSFPLQMRKISPNMNIGAVVPHQAEYGETVESIMKRPEEIIAKKSEIPHADATTKQATDSKKETVAKPEAAETNDASKKDFLQQPFTGQQQQQAAFQTMSQFGALQGGQNAAYQMAPAAAVAPAVMAQPAAAAASNPAAIPGEPCTDQYDTCTDFAKNQYCVRYPAQMSIQCRKSCKYCVAPEVPAVDSKQQIATATQGASSTLVAQGHPEAQTAQEVPVTNKEEDSSGSGSGDSSGSGDVDQDAAAKRSSSVTNSLYLPELGSGSESGSGSGDSFASGSEAAVVRQLASAQNIVSGIGMSADTNKPMNSTKKSFVPIMRNALKPRKAVASPIVKKSNIPQRPVSPLTAMDAENVNNPEDDDDDDVSSASGSGSGSGEEVTSQQIDTKSKIPEVAKKPQAATESKNKKKSEIPQKPAAAPAVSSAYPRIDLRRIASALANYEEAALNLAGEYPHITAADSDLVTRSQIPHPASLAFPYNKLRQNIQIAKLVTQDDHKRFEIPKYLLVGDQITEKDGIAKDSALPAADSIESVTQRFQVPGIQPSLQDLYAETGRAPFESEAAKRMRIFRKKKKKVQRPVDPFEYLRNMPAGASMEPIIDPHSKSSTRQSVSYPVYLMKVMPGSHKYVPATTRSKVDSVPKRGEQKSKAPPAPVAAAQAPAPKQEPLAPVNNLPEFEAGPGPEMDSVAVNGPVPDFNTVPESEVQLGPAKEQPAFQVANEAAQQFPSRNQQRVEMVQNMKEEQPSLRTKMLSAFFHKKGEEQGSGSGEGSQINTRETIWGTGGLIPEQPLMMPALQ